VYNDRATWRIAMRTWDHTRYGYDLNIKPQHTKIKKEQWGDLWLVFENGEDQPKYKRQRLRSYRSMKAEAKEKFGEGK
jgi:hypothetical protein